MPEPTVPSSIVYLLGAGRRDRRVKIGTTTDLDARLRDLRAANAYNIRVIATGPGGRTEEAALHAHYGRSRHHGEWFLLNPGQIAECADMIRTGRTPFSPQARRVVAQARDYAAKQAAKRAAGLLPRDGRPAASRVKRSTL